MYYLKRYFFVDEATFSINVRNPFARSIPGTPAVIMTLFVCAVSYTILGAFFAVGIISVKVIDLIKLKTIADGDS